MSDKVPQMVLQHNLNQQIYLTEAISSIFLKALSGFVVPSLLLLKHQETDYHLC